MSLILNCFTLACLLLVLVMQIDTLYISHSDAGIERRWHRIWDPVHGLLDRLI